ncbi:MAG: DUF3021 family protein [Oscillospiraceae bacterium]|nr:DUF3021 family protein [Oscillospiraceae bacterium]
MKERIIEMARSYFISVTLINVAIFVTGTLFRPEQTMGYEAFLSPLLFGFLTVIPTMILYSKKELTVRQLLCRKAIQLLLDIVIVIAVIFAGNDMNRETIIAAVGVAVSIVVVFVAVHVIEWMLERRTARELTEQLAAFQKRNGEF